MGHYLFMSRLLQLALLLLVHLGAWGQSVKKTDIEALTGVTLKEPTVEKLAYPTGSITRYRAVKPRPYDAEVCIVTLSDASAYDQSLKVDKKMGYQGELSGLGDKAYWTYLGQGIGAYTKVAVKKGQHSVSVVLTDSKPGLARLEATKQLVTKLLSGL